MLKSGIYDFQLEHYKKIIVYRLSSRDTIKYWLETLVRRKARPKHVIRKINDNEIHGRSNLELIVLDLGIMTPTKGMFGIAPLYIFQLRSNFASQIGTSLRTLL